MSNTTQRRGPGRPKKQAAAETAVATPPAPKSVKKTVVRKEPEKATHSEYELLQRGGIVTMIPMRGVTVFDESQNTVREIRYCPNEPSIYVDEQSEHAKREALFFRDGKLFVPREKPNLLAFMNTHPGNADNGGGVFKRVDKKLDAEKEMEREFAVSEAITKVRNTDITDLLPVALYFNVNIDRNTSEIRFDLLRLAKKDPAEFMQAFDNPQVQARSIAKQAADYQIIALRENGAYWFDTNKLIVSVPVGRTPLDVITRFLLTEQGATVYGELEEKLEKLA